MRPSGTRRNRASPRSSSPTGTLLPGVVIETDLGPWTVHETPGHSPSHVCLFQPERRLLISGDHLLGRISLHFDYGYSADPVGEFLHSLDVVEELNARLCLAGHGRTFTDVHAHIEGNRELVAERLEKTLAAIGRAEPPTAYRDRAGVTGGEALPAVASPWLIAETLAMLRAPGGHRVRPAYPRRARALGPRRTCRAVGVTDTRIRSVHAHR